MHKIGRKNYLFAGSHEAAGRSAMLYSLMGTCKLNDLNPFTWMKDTLEKIAQYPINRIGELLPITENYLKLEPNPAVADAKRYVN